MITEQEISIFIDGLARKFENSAHAESDNGDPGNGVGWGQFLDGPPLQTQIGPYGTCSGMLVRALAGRGSDQLAQHAGQLLNLWWGLRKTKEEEMKLFSQTTRVAILLLALRIANLESTQVTLSEAHEYLLSTLRPDKMWGNYAIPAMVEDATPRLFPTAIALLSFALFREEHSPLPDELQLCAEKLEERLLGTKDLPALHIAAAAAAILAVKNGKASKKIKDYIKKWAYATQPSLPDLGVYFYDLEFPNSAGDRNYDRDYFILPTEILLGIAGFQRGAPTYLRLRAESSLAALVENLRGYDGFYRPDKEQRLSSLNQAWVTMYLALATINHSGPGYWSRFCFSLLRQRPDAFWTDAILLLSCSSGVVLASVARFPVISSKSLTVNALAAILAFIAGRFYAPPFLRKVFTGRE
jgi:hypothetical protein